MIAESRIIAAGKVIPIPWATIPFFSAEIRVYYLWYLSLFFITFWYEGSGLRGEGRTRTKEPFPSPSCSWSPRWSIWYCNQYHCCVIIIPRLLFCFLNHVIKDINQDISVGDIGLIEVPKEDRQKHGQRNLLVQVLDLEKNQLVLAPLIDRGLGPNLRTRYSMEAFLKSMTFPISCLSLSKKNTQYERQFLKEW